MDPAQGDRTRDAELSSTHINAMSVEDLEATIRRHNHLYWDRQAPEISDYAYDRLVRELERRCPQSPVLEQMGPSLIGRYGAEVRHLVPMLSLDKCYDDESLLSWAVKFEGKIMASPKMDGIAASLRYDERGRLVLAATRGSGLAGEDITANAHTLEEIPRKVKASTIEVRGELYMRRSVFEAFGEQFSNARNLAAGAIKSKDPARCREYRLSFAPYDLLGSDSETEAAKMRALVALGFCLVEYRLVDREEMREAYQYFAASRGALDYEIDGVVFKADRVMEQQRLGATAHHPRFAIAYKFQGDSSTTVLDSVSWSVARTGVITPVAHVQPIELSGATISRASLHHAGFIAKLGLSLGAEVVVTRRGGVIPKVELVAKSGGEAVTIPTSCPSCGGPLTTRGDFLVCAEPRACRDAILGTIAHYASVVDIQGFGDKLLADGYDKGLLRGPADIYRLGKDQLLQLDRVGEKLADKLLRQIDEHRRIPLSVFLRALGIEELGQHVAGVLADRFAPLERVLQVTSDELAAVHGVGDIIANKVVRGLADQGPLIDALLQQVEVESEIISPAHDPDLSSGLIAGKSFVFTGKLVAFDRKTAQKRVVAAGGSAPSHVTKDLDYLVVGAGQDAGSKASAKQSKADKLVAAGAPLQIISETQFLAMIEGTSPTDDR